jgi:glycerophosphoryl diester phosphodiesterase
VPPERSIPPDFAIIAHRGAAQEAPENTIDAFARALDLGANAIETDVCITQDGHFVLWHDADPDDVVAIARQSGAEGLGYVPNVPALGSPWRRPIRELPLAVFQTRYGYSQRKPTLAELGSGDTPPEAGPARLTDFMNWLWRELRVRHVFLDLKLLPAQVQAAISLYRRLYRGCTRNDFRHDLVLHVLSPHREIVTALMAEAQRLTPPPTLRLYADFEYPGVCDVAPRLGVRHVSMGCSLRSWGDYRHEIARVIATREQGHLDAVIAWTINDAERLQELVALGVNGVMTDTPALLQRIVAEHRHKVVAMGLHPSPGKRRARVRKQGKNLRGCRVS